MVVPSMRRLWRVPTFSFFGASDAITANRRLPPKRCADNLGVFLFLTLDAAFPSQWCRPEHEECAAARHRQQRGYRHSASLPLLNCHGIAPTQQRWQCYRHAVSTAEPRAVRAVESPAVSMVELPAASRVEPRPQRGLSPVAPRQYGTNDRTLVSVLSSQFSVLSSQFSVLITPTPPASPASHAARLPTTRHSPRSPAH